MKTTDQATRELRELFCDNCTHNISKAVDIISEFLFKKTGSDGGKKAAANMTPRARKQRAKKAAETRWKNDKIA